MNTDRGSSREAIFWLQIAYLLILFGIGAWYLSLPEGQRPTVLIGSLPVGVLWFGALGAVIISLTGVFDHRGSNWDPSFKLWYWSRPVMGAAIAMVAVLIFQAGVLSVQPAQPAPGTASGQPTLYYVIAFLVAYREETFRELIKRATDVILKPATPTLPPRATGLTPAQGASAGGDPVTITGTGLMGTTRVAFGDNAAFFRIDSDGEVTATSPAGATATSVAVVVSGKGGSTTAGKLSYT